MTENLCTTRSVLTIGFLQSVPSTRTPEFGAILDQRTHDQTSHLNEKYKQLTTDYEELY
jgi:hypothetical protein